MVHISSPFIIHIYTHKFSPAAHTFPSLALYSHGVTETFVFVVPYDNISDISEYFHPHIIFGKVLHQIGRMICDPHHNFVAIKGIDCVTYCLNFYTFWE